MADASLTGLPFADVRKGLDGRSVTAAELTDAYLERIEALPELSAYRYVDDDGARARAVAADRELDAGKRLGALHGIPIGVKECFGVEGLPFTGGCLAFEELRAPADADVVARARGGGAVILGVQRMSENAMGAMVRDGARATGANPRHPDFAPGGSSSGSAVAAAAGLCALSLGADGGGSVRNPAAASGVIGFKPTDNRLPGDGCHPWTVTMLTPGFLARDLDAIAAGLDVMAETVSSAARERPPRLAVVRAEDLGELDDAVKGGFSEATGALAAAGAQLVDAPGLDLHVMPTWLARMREFAHAHALPVMQHGESYTEGMRDMLAFLGSTSAVDYIASFEAAARFRAQVDAALDGVDAIILPVNPTPALRWEEWTVERVLDWYRLCMLCNLTWHPAVSLPWALTAEGLPVAYQLIGRQNGDEALVGVARWCDEQSSFDKAPVPAIEARPGASRSRAGTGRGA